MKKNIIFVLTIVLTLLSSCDYLDKQPDDQRTDETVWTNRREVESYLRFTYSYLPYHDFWREDPWVGCSDECDLSWVVYGTHGINLGHWTPETNWYVKWGDYYKGIRASIVFEKNVDRCYELSDDLRKRYKAEAKFLRAYYYWLLLRQYGPVILINEQLASDTDWSTLKRSPYDECVKYICDLFDEAAVDLPMHWRNDVENLGRGSKLGCKAAKSIVLHHAASPQFNGNKEYANFKNPDGTQLINTQYSVQKWKDAAAAAKEVIQIAETMPDAQVKLYKNSENGGGTFNPYKSLVDVQLKVWNSEIIFGRSDMSNTYAWQIHSFPGPRNLGGIGPTQRLVDAFLMKNGMPIEAAGSGYVETGWATTPGDHWNPNNRDVATEQGRKEIISDIRSSDAWGHWKNEWNMYANREPRFYAAILYNKRIPPAFSDDRVKRDTQSSVGQKDGYGRAELYYGGVSRQSGSYTFYSKTGYLANKYNDPQNDMYDRTYTGQVYNMTYIRYATILLNYIEALNEFDSGNSDIRKFWDMIRERAGVPSAFVATPHISGNQEEQREYIIRERQVELCFEGDRYTTTRRLWRAHNPDLGAVVDNRKFGDGGRFWGMSVDAGNAASNNFEYTGFYEKSDFETRVFRKEFYLFPIPKKELDKYQGSVVQNPWW